MQRIVLVGFNVFAAAGCFLAGAYGATLVPGLLAIGSFALGLFGVAHFVRRAESARALGRT